MDRGSCSNSAAKLRSESDLAQGKSGEETWVQSLGQEDLLEEGMAIPSSVLAWRIPWTEEPDGLLSIWSQRVRHD